MEAVEPPEGLADAGRALWLAVVGEYELAPAELALLAQACRTVDEVEAISEAIAAGPVVVPGSTGQPKVSGLFAEARAHRVVLARLLEQLALPDEGEDVGKTPNQLRASKAAQTRWSLHRERHGAA
ncbi:hypothetical protein [Streptomyces chartreusis]|uniref:hypothetical protein n=1 Tax=Streptomyces chartreusis TaxID=1969 RepID=UPI003869204E|nr:hypothetical protein OG938_31710 [Streptomyces chartreusis]